MIEAILEPVEAEDGPFLLPDTSPTFLGVSSVSPEAFYQSLFVF